MYEISNIMFITSLILNIIESEKKTITIKTLLYNITKIYYIEKLLIYLNYIK